MACGKVEYRQRWMDKQEYRNKSSHLTVGGGFDAGCIMIELLYFLFPGFLT